MDLQAYIESGKLEAYLLGDLSEAEALEVEQLAQKYPEIRAELDNLEQTMESLAVLAGQAPPPGTLSAVLDRIPTNGTDDRALSTNRWLWGLGLVALIGLVLGIFFFRQNRLAQKEWQSTQEQLQRLETACDDVSEKNQQLSRALTILLAEDTRQIDMQGTDQAPGAIASIFVNPQSQVALLNPGNLPETPTDKTYQLWALIDGEPVDMGIFPTTGTDDGALREVPYIPEADAYAVTLEDAGGSPTPSLNQLFVIGQVS